MAWNAVPKAITMDSPATARPSRLADIAIADATSSPWAACTPVVFASRSPTAAHRTGEASDGAPARAGSGSSDFQPEGLASDPRPQDLAGLADGLQLAGLLE